MSFIDKLYNKGLIFSELVILLSISILHIVFGFLIKRNEFNIYALFDSSPLFDFSLGSNCRDKSAVIFYRWGGIKEEIKRHKDDDGPGIIIYDETDIKMINGNYFCFKNISYINLLKNGQIIKKKSKCPSEYPKNCGRLDTLEQELCIKEYDFCPLYDIGIGNKSDDDNYIYDEKSNIYYNKENYNKENKTIIGRLQLNDGQPCYYSLEKLWKKFDDKEAVDTHLKCEMEVFSKYNDDRYENKGNITYKRLYEDNLNQRCKDIILNHLTGEEKVSLFKREFLGINKECDRKYNLSKDSFDKFHDYNQNERTLLIAGGIALTILPFCSMIAIIIVLNTFNNERKFKDTLPPFVMFILYCIYMAGFIPCFICHIIYYYKLINYNIERYDCSDSITNELIRKGIEDNNKQVLYATINFYLDVFQTVNNCLFIPIFIILMRIDKLKGKYNKQKEEPSDDIYNEPIYNEENEKSNYPKIPLITNYPDNK